MNLHIFSLHICALNRNSICEFMDLSIYTFVKPPTYNNLFLHVRRKGTHYIWVRLESRKAELKQQVKLSLAKYFGLFCHDCRYNIRFIFTNTKPHNYRIPKNQNIPNTPSRCLNFGFLI